MKQLELLINDKEKDGSLNIYWLNYAYLKFL